MELEELKAGWNVLNERLQQNEILNRRIITEMIKNRTKTVVTRLLLCDVGSLLVMILVTLCLATMSLRFPVTLPPVLSIVLIAFVVSVCIWYAVKIPHMLRFNIETMSIVKMQEWLLRYKKYAKYEAVSTPAIAIAIFVVLSVTMHRYNNTLTLILDIAIVVIIPPLCYVLYKYTDKRYIQTIEQGIEELKEFKE